MSKTEVITLRTSPKQKESWRKAYLKNADIEETPYSSWLRQMIELGIANIKQGEGW